MDAEKCAICLCACAATGDHRIVSLKCGHVFGSACAKRWFRNKKRAECPTCHAPGRASEIRTIYATRIVAVDDSVSADLRAARAVVADLEEENRKLCTLVRYLGSELAKSEEALANTQSVHKRLAQKLRVRSDAFAIVAYDESTDAVLYASRNAVWKICAERAVVVFSAPGAIRDLKAGNGRVCVASEKDVRVAEKSDVRAFCADADVLSVCFDPADDDVVFAGDAKGHVNTLSVRTGAFSRRFVAHCPIHSLHKTSAALFCAGYLGVFCVSGEKTGDAVCTNLFGKSDALVAVFRNSKMQTTHVVCGKPLVTGNVQFKRRRDKIFGNLLFSIDDVRNVISVHDTRTASICHVYRLRDAIFDFVCTPDRFFILTERGFYVFAQ